MAIDAAVESMMLRDESHEERIERPPYLLAMLQVLRSLESHEERIESFFHDFLNLFDFLRESHEERIERCPQLDSKSLRRTL